jgi:hypothetical protein
VRSLIWRQLCLVDPTGIRINREAAARGDPGRNSPAENDPCLFPFGGHVGTRERPCEGGCREMCELHPDAGRSETAGDVLVLLVFGPDQERGCL